MSIDRVRDLCLAAREALETGGPDPTQAIDWTVRLANARKVLEHAVTLAESSVGSGSYAHIQALLILGWVVTEAQGCDAARSIVERVETFYPQVVQVQPHDGLHVLGALAQWFYQAGDRAKASQLGARLQDLAHQVYGADHPRTLLLKSQGLDWLGAKSERPLGLWHF